MSGAVAIIPHDDRWAALFEREKTRLEAALLPYLLAVEHIGSTSIPGLAAKPTIDIMAGIHRLLDAPRIIPRMEKLGYAYIPKFEAEIPERRYFSLAGPEDGPQLSHVHMAEVGSAFWERHLLFRDYLRSHGQVAHEYEVLKRKLASVHAGDVEAYTGAKTEFIGRVEGEARAERDTKALIRRASEGAPPHP